MVPRVGNLSIGIDSVNLDAVSLRENKLLDPWRRIDIRRLQLENDAAPPRWEALEMQPGNPINEFEMSTYDGNEITKDSEKCGI